MKNLLILGVATLVSMNAARADFRLGRVRAEAKAISAIFISLVFPGRSGKLSRSPEVYEKRAERIAVMPIKRVFLISSFALKITALVKLTARGLAFM